MDKFEELVNKIEELASEIEKLKTEEESRTWKPKYGEKYYYLTMYGSTRSADYWIGSLPQNRMYEIGNVFRTQEEAEFRAEQLKVEAELRRFARPFENGSENYTLGYRHLYDRIEITFFETIQCGNLYFPSKEIAQKAIDTVGADRIKKYYFGVIN